MELRQYARMLRGHWLLIAAAALVCTLLAGFSTARVPATYRSTTTLLVSSSGDNGDLSESYQGDLLAKARVNTYADLVRAPTVLQAVIDRLRLPDSVSSLQSRITVVVPEETTLIRVSADGGSPTAAKAIADTVAAEFAHYVATIENDRGRLRHPITVTPLQAATPAGSVGPHRLMALMVGLLAGLLLGVGAAVLRERLDGRVRDEVDVARLTEAPVLGTVPGRKWPRRRARASPESRDEAYRNLASLLLRIQEDRGGGPIVLLGPTKVASGSQLAANITQAMARSALRVVLITPIGDEPAWGKIAPSSWPGLFDVLAGMPVDLVLRPAEGRPAVLLLPAGASGDTRPALDPRQVAKIMADLQERADVVLIDPPPLDQSADGAVLAACSDGAFLVVRPGRTRRADLARALATLRDLSTAPRGVLFNTPGGSAEADALRPAKDILVREEKPA
jgi:capsular polysaccharide biosynthesis protein/Mrp family chromosome partitioning ATPase